MNTTTPDLQALIELSEKASPGPWEALGDEQGHPGGLEWSIYSPTCADEDDTDWIAGPDGGDGIATTGCPGHRPDADFIVGLVNWFRAKGAALAELMAAGAAMAVLYDGPDCTDQEDIAASERFKRALIAARGTSVVDRTTLTAPTLPGAGGGDALDAARYRGLRNGLLTEGDVFIARLNAADFHPQSAANFDAAIDAAIDAALPPQQGG